MLVPPNESDSIEKHGEYLLALLDGPYSIFVRDGEMVLLEIKVLVEKIRGMKIEIYPKEHAPPHFHVKTPSFSASFRIDDCSILSGEIPSNQYNKIRYWHKLSKLRLIDEWNTMRPTICPVGVYKEVK